MSIQFIISAGVESNILGLVLMYVSNNARRMLQTAAPVRTVTAHHLSVKHCFLFSSVGCMLKWLTFGKKDASIMFWIKHNIIISNTSPEELKCSIKLVMTETSNWFQSNFLSLNCDKSHFLQFLTKNKMK
jgi:hypothetical protein